MLEKKLHLALQELLLRADVARVLIRNTPEEKDSIASDLTLHWRSLGGKTHLGIYHRALHSPDLMVAIEECVRSIRFNWRLTGEAIPEIELPKKHINLNKQIEERIESYLLALVGACHASQGYVMHHGAIISRAGESNEQRVDSLNLLSRQLDKAGMNSSNSSHATIERDEMFAMSFYYGAALFLFFDAPYSTSFTRHRARLVVRELSDLLSSFDEPPPSPAAQNLPPKS